MRWKHCIKTTLGVIGAAFEGQFAALHEGQCVAPAAFPGRKKERPAGPGMST